MKKYSKWFIIGAVFGIILFFIIVAVPFDFPRGSVTEKIFRIIWSPAYIINITDTIIIFLDYEIFHNDMSRGLAFDGGPLEWLEWTSIVISMAVCYGLIFLLGAALHDWYKKRKKYSHPA